MSAKKNSKDDISVAKKESQVLQRKIIEAHQGPLPHPEILKRYEEIVQGAATRILEMAEQEAAHRHSMEKRLLEIDLKALKAEMLDARLGQIFGFLIAVITVVSGVYCSINGAQIAGGFIGTAGVAGIVSVFVLGRKKGNK